MSVFIDKIGKSLIRTVTPWLIGFAVTYLAKIGFDWHPTPEQFVLVSQFLSALFYAGVRWLEINVAPKFGWLLGSLGAPKYEADTTGL